MDLSISWRKKGMRGGGDSRFITLRSSEMAVTGHLAPLLVPEKACGDETSAGAMFEQKWGRGLTWRPARLPA